MQSIFGHKSCLLIIVLFAILSSACSELQPTPSPTITIRPSPIPSRTATLVPTLTSTPAPTATPTATATPAPLNASAIFDRVSPAIAFIETANGSGSGILIDDGYIVTNAHVVWPFETVRVVFPDGSEHLDVSLIGWDLLADLAVLGPIEVSDGVQTVTFVDGERSVVGSDVYLIGYPGEVDEFPQPTITRGLISRLREWEPIEMTYFQTDAAIAGGQSGGVLVSEMGDVIGVSGFSFSEAEFGLVASAADLTERIAALIGGEELAGVVDRRLPSNDGKASHFPTLWHNWHTRSYVISETVGTEVEINVEEGEAEFAIYDSLSIVDSYETSPQTLSIEFEGPYFINIYPVSEYSSSPFLHSSHPVMEIDDPDDGKPPQPGQPLNAAIDYPGDQDHFPISLDAGEEIYIHVDSLLIDPLLTVAYQGASLEDTVGDDDSAGGLFGTNAELTFRAPSKGTYFIVVETFGYYGAAIGGYILTTGEPQAGAPTPMAPPPTATPIVSEFGEMLLYESEAFPFTMEYSAIWLDDLSLVPEQWTAACGTEPGLSCLTSPFGLLTIGATSLAEVGLSDITLEEFVDLTAEGISEIPSFELVLREPFSTSEGLTGIRLIYEITDANLMYNRFMYLHDDDIFYATYIVSDEVYEEMLPVIEYSFSTFRVDR